MIKGELSKARKRFSMDDSFGPINLNRTNYVVPPYVCMYNKNTENLLHLLQFSIEFDPKDNSLRIK